MDPQLLWHVTRFSGCYRGFSDALLAPGAHYSSPSCRKCQPLMVLSWAPLELLWTAEIQLSQSQNNPHLITGQYSGPCLKGRPPKGLSLGLAEAFAETTQQPTFSFCSILILLHPPHWNIDLKSTLINFSFLKSPSQSLFPRESDLRHT